MYTCELLEDVSDTELLTGGELHRPKRCFLFALSLMRSLAANLEKQQAGIQTLAAVLAGLFGCSTLSPGVSKTVI